MCFLQCHLPKYLHFADWRGKGAERRLRFTHASHGFFAEPFSLMRPATRELTRNFGQWQKRPHRRQSGPIPLLVKKI